MSSEKYIPTHKVSEEAVNLIADDRSQEKGISRPQGPGQRWVLGGHCLIHRKVVNL